EGILDMKLTYANSLVKIPTPELYVLYNGTEEWPTECTLQLSDAFLVSEKEPFLELNVKVLNINTEKHHQILEKSHTLNEYSLFIERVRAYLHKDYKRDQAMEQAIRECIQENILKDFLMTHGKTNYQKSTNK
ncbi:MAG: hypothetical protein RR369_01160, partial [Lachnospiraceae bacterium]